MGRISISRLTSVVCHFMSNWPTDRTRAGDLLWSNSSIDYALDAFSATILAWGSIGRVAAYFGDLASLACLLGSAGEKHGRLSCVGHFGWIIQLLLTWGKCQGDSIRRGKEIITLQEQYRGKVENEDRKSNCLGKTIHIYSLGPRNFQGIRWAISS